MPKRKKATTAAPSAPPPPPGVTEGENNTTHTEPLPPPVEEITVAETETTTVTSTQVSMECLVMQLPNDAYAKRRVDVILSRKAAEGWRAYAHGLEKQEAQLASGKFVRGTSDAVRYFGEMLAKQFLE